MKTSRSKKALYGTITGIIGEVVSLICGLILPRLILSTFGSAYNGITSSVSQFISMIALMKAGLGGVTRAALYKPLAEGNTQEVSVIVNQTQSFLRKLAGIFILFVLILAIIYPIWICDDFEWLFSASLVLIISLSSFARYYFGMTAQMVLSADQRAYVPAVFTIVGTILNTIISAVLIRLGAGIHLVKLGSALIFTLRPIILNTYVKKRYRIDPKAHSDIDHVKQRWDAFGHEIAGFINGNTDIMVLTVLSTLSTVSVYTVYHSVIRNIRKILMIFITGFGAAFGNMYALKQYRLMEENLRVYEMIVFSAASVIYSVTMVMLTPFVIIYTRGVTDADYSQPLFGLVLALAGAFGCYKIPYETVVKALGHYKQTRTPAFIEAGINIGLSVLCVFRFGLVGVAIGTLAAMVYRSFVYARYLRKNLIPRSGFIFIGHVILASAVNLLTVATSLFYMKEQCSIPEWILFAVITTLIAAGYTLLFNLLFYRSDSVLAYRKILGVFRCRRDK